MSDPCVHLALIGDYNDEVLAHRTIPTAIDLASAAEQIPVEYHWLETLELLSPVPDCLSPFHAIWVVPNSPYRNGDGVLAAIRYARESRVPFLGTCGGFQYAVIEFARNVLGFADAAHAEEHPAASRQVISPLSCSLVEKTGEVRFAEGSRIRSIYGVPSAVEGYHCNYGLNASFNAKLEAAGLRFGALDRSSDVRALEWPEHPFFIGTLFQPERAASRGEAPPLVRAFLRAAQSARQRT